MPLPNLPQYGEGSVLGLTRTMSASHINTTDDYEQFYPGRVVMVDAIYRVELFDLYINAGGADFLVQAGDVFSLIGLTLSDIQMKNVVAGSNGKLTVFGAARV